MAEKQEFYFDKEAADRTNLFLGQAFPCHTMLSFLARKLTLGLDQIKGERSV